MPEAATLHLCALHYNDTASWRQACTVFTRPWTVNTTVHTSLLRNIFEVSTKAASRLFVTWNMRNIASMTQDSRLNSGCWEAASITGVAPWWSCAWQCISSEDHKVIMVHRWSQMGRWASMLIVPSSQHLHSWDPNTAWIHPTWNCWVGAESGTAVLAKWQNNRSSHANVQKRKDAI